MISPIPWFVKVVQRGVIRSKWEGVLIVFLDVRAIAKKTETKKSEKDASKIGVEKNGGFEITMNHKQIKRKFDERLKESDLKPTLTDFSIISKNYDWLRIWNLLFEFDSISFKAIIVLKHFYRLAVKV